MPTDDPFQSVVDAARSGAEWAWARLVNDIDGTLRGYVRRQGGVDVDDLVGETWLHVARGLHRFAGDESAFRSWVFMIAHHRIIDERRRRRRRPVELTEQTALARLGPSRDSAESVAMERLDEEQFQHILEQLSPAQREVVLLRFVAGFGIKEIADIVGKKPGAVQALQRRAFKQLEKILR
ncbi:MAG: RNA polymerase sigma factor [Rhodothermia bacterium]